MFILQYAGRMLLIGFLLFLPGQRTLHAQSAAPVSPSSTGPTRPVTDGSQNTAPQTVIRVTSRLVVLDIVVTDKQGKPVTDLTRDDFEITEGKDPQRVRSFEAPISHALPAGALVHSSADIAKIGNSPVNILVLDALNTRFEDNAFSQHSLLKFLDRQPAIMPPTTLLVANDKRFAVLQDYTQERDVLEAALKRNPVQYPWRLARNGDTSTEGVIRLMQSLNALQEIAQAAAGTQGRKNIMWVGKGFPSVDMTGMDDASSKPLKDAIKRCIDLLLSSRVTLYIIDPTPLSSTMYDISTPNDLATLEAETGTEPFGDAIRFSALAPATGGRVFSARNDVDKEIATSMRDGSLYYTLSYAPTGVSDEPGAYRNIHVTLKRPGLTAATRDGYYTQSQPGDLPATVEPGAAKLAEGVEVMDVANAVLSKMVYNGVKIRAAKGARGRYTLAIADATLNWQPNAKSGFDAPISIVAVCFSASGKVLSHTAEERVLNNMSPSANASSEEIIMAPVMIPAGTARLRFVVRNSVTGRLGSADIENP
ncbi:MAG TPA: VWA domain-containing protein [Acidobacteriaceae bacterium]